MIVALNFIALTDTQTTGPFRYIHNILNVMNEYDILDTHFIVYKQKHIPAELIGIPQTADVEYINVPTLGRGLKRVIFEQTLFYQYIKPCDIFYSYCTSMPLFVHAKRVFTLHDIYYITNPERYRWFQRAYLTIITRIYARAAHEILTVSRYSFEQIQKYIPIAKNKLTITYNILPVNIGTSTIVETGNKPYFLFVGSIQPSKNIVKMIDGFCCFNTQGTYQLIIVGKPQPQSSLILAHIQNADNVKYMGYLDDAQITYLYQHTVAVVLVSLCEGFGIPPLEGFRFGAPALVANTTSLPEVVGKAGIKVNPRDIQAIADGFTQVVNHHAQLSKHIPERLRFFDKNHSCEKWMESLHIIYKHK